MNPFSRPNFSTSSGGADTSDSPSVSGPIGSEVPSSRPADGRASSGVSTAEGEMQGDNPSRVLVLSNMRDAPEVEDQPFVCPSQWRVIKVNDSSLRLALLVNAGKTVRVTTPLVAMDPVLRRVRTKSGRVYRLDGLPSDDELLISTLLAFAASNRFGSLEYASFEDLCRLKQEDFH